MFNNEQTPFYIRQATKTSPFYKANTFLHQQNQTKTYTFLHQNKQPKHNTTYSFISIKNTQKRKTGLLGILLLIIMNNILSENCVVCMEMVRKQW